MMTKQYSVKVVYIIKDPNHVTPVVDYLSMCLML